MFIRLWWKEFRVFAPVWLILAVAAGSLQLLLILTRSDDAGTGALTFAACCWAVLYAFAVASAAFSGERETNTLGFLDTLPVPRRMLWFGKSTFAIVSTVGLVGFLLALAELGTVKRDAIGLYSWASIFETFLPLLIGGVAWGLLWSALSKNTLLAAILAVLTVLASNLLTIGVLTVLASNLLTIDQLITRPTWYVQWHTIVQFLVSLLALGGSLVALAWRPSWNWSLVKNGAVRPSRPIRVRRASTSASLFWQVAREGWSTAFLVALMASMLPYFAWLQDSRLEGLLHLVLATLASLIAGVSVFGLESSTGGRRFLVNHGVKASAVWFDRLLAWILVMAAILGLIAAMILTSNPSIDMPHLRQFSIKGSHLFLLTFATVDAFAIGVLCGMMIRRRITAALVGAMAWVFLIPIQFLLVAMDMIPAGSLVLTPLMLLAISAAWANDWLLELEGLRRWVRLTFLTVGSLSLLLVGYITYRGLGVPDFGPIAINPSMIQPIPSRQNAADLYRRAFDLIKPDRRARLNQESYVENLIMSGNVDLVFSKRQAALDQLKEALKIPRLAFEPTDRLGLDADSLNDYGAVRALSALLILDSLKLKAGGDLAGSWDEILDLFRMANQLVATAPTIVATETSIKVHQHAIRSAFEWLSDPKLTVEMTRKALADLKALPRVSDMSNCLRYESFRIEQACDLQGDELTRWIIIKGGKTAVISDVLQVNWLVTPAWERLRARRVCRAIIADDLPLVAAEPWKRGLFALDPDRYNRPYRGSPLAQALLPPIPNIVDQLDHAIVDRLALEQVLALLVWKLEHGGKDAEKLTDIVPSLLDKLPLDPYSGQPFGYGLFEDKVVGRAGLMRMGTAYGFDIPAKTSHYYLFGSGMVQTGGQTVSSGDGRRPASGDFLYIVP